MKRGFILLLILLCSLALNLVSLRADHNWGGDFAQYIKQSQAISSGEYSALIDCYSFCQASSSQRTAPILYPWGYPIMLWSVTKVVGMNIKMMKMISIFFFIASLLVIYLLFRSSLDSTARLLVSALFAFNPFFVSFKENIIADIPFFFFTLLALFLIDHFFVLKRTLFNPLVDHLLIGVVIFCALFTKTQGFLLLPVLAIIQLAEFRATLSAWRAQTFVILVLPYVTAGFLYFATTLVLPTKTDSYLMLAHENLVLHPQIFFDNLKYYSRLSIDFFYDRTYLSHFNGLRLTSSVIFLLSIPLVLISIKSDWRRSIVGITYSLLSLAALTFYPQGGLRLILPLMPFYTYFLVQGAGRIANALRIKNGVKLFCSALLTFFLFQASLIVLDSRANSQMTDGPYTKESQELFACINENTTLSDVLIFRKPGVLNLFTGRCSLMISGVNEFFQKKAFAKYLVIDRTNATYQIPLDSLNALIAQGVIANFWENERFQIWKICNLKYENSRLKLSSIPYNLDTIPFT